MSFSKAVDLLRLAMMATGRRGICLADVEAEFGGVRRTAQRMIAALQEAFPQVRLAHDLRSALRDCDAVMLLRIQHERQRKTMFPSIGEYTALFGLTKARLARTKPDVLIMHPGPINRGVEIDSELADGERSVILEQVTNGIAVRMAVLFLCAGGRPDQLPA